MINRTHIFTLIFDTSISNYEIPLFRGAIIDLTKNTDNELFHNHIKEKFRYSYPLIQYKRINGNAAIICVDEGAEAIGKFFANFKHTISLGERRTSLKIQKVLTHSFLIQAWQAEFVYNIKRWLPLNSENYTKYVLLQNNDERIKFLQKILVANILSMAKGLNIVLEKEIWANIVEIEEPFVVSNNHTKLLSFNAVFTTNMSLPNLIGLGKNVSIGFGTIKQINNHSENN